MVPAPAPAPGSVWSVCVCCCSRANDVSLTTQGTDQCIPREPVPLAGTRLFCALPDYQKPEQKEEGGARPTVPKSRIEQIRNHPPSYAALRRRAPITNLKCSIEKSAHEGERERDRARGRQEDEKSASNAGCIRASASLY